MGLTIHYSLHSRTRGYNRARALVAELRHAATDFSFQEIGPLVELSGAECSFEGRGRDDPLRWLLIQASQLVKCSVEGRLSAYVRVEPTQVIAFKTLPGAGCEPANFGLCRYPALVAAEVNGRQRTVHTGLSGWRWSSFCKTIYAGDPECGGPESFMSCHLKIVRMLDTVSGLGILAGVSDESGFYGSTPRDLVKLARHVVSNDDEAVGLTWQFRGVAGGQIVTVEPGHQIARRSPTPKEPRHASNNFANTR